MAKTGCKKRKLTALVVAALASSCGGESELSMSERQRVVDEVTAFATTYGAALESGDEDAVRRVLVTDGRFGWFEDGAKTYADVDAVVQSLENLKNAGMVLRTEYSDVDVLALTRDHAHLSAAFQTHGTMTHGAEFAFDGTVTMLVERTDGAWRVVFGHTSTGSGPPSG